MSCTAVQYGRLVYAVRDEFRNISIESIVLSCFLIFLLFYAFTQRYQHTVELSVTSDIPQKAAEPGVGQLRDVLFLKSAKRKPERVSRYAIRARSSQWFAHQILHFSRSHAFCSRFDRNRLRNQFRSKTMPTSQKWFLFIIAKYRPRTISTLPLMPAKKYQSYLITHPIQTAMSVSNWRGLPVSLHLCMQLLLYFQQVMRQSWTWDSHEHVQHRYCIYLHKIFCF